MKKEQVLKLISDEIDRATAAHARMRGLHEGYAIILEEVDELWDEIKAKRPDYLNIQKEAIQVAAMGARFLMDIFLTELKGQDENHL